jgi:hypothetical protein
MAEPKADSIKCDVPGCHRPATYRTDGKEKDTVMRRLGQTDENGVVIEPARDELLNRPAIPNINVCAPHKNWPHSEDAKMFALGKDYQARK